MATQTERTRWKAWAESLRQTMMVGLTPSVTKTIVEISAEVGTNKASKTLHSSKFWRSCQHGEGSNDVLTKAGFDLEFQESEDGCVVEVTLRLNSTWLAILEGI